MTYKIIGDSCLDLTEDMKKDPRFQMIPLTLQVGSAQVVDDETFDQKRFIEMVKAVSYTHLDVYKRQAGGGGQGRICGPAESCRRPYGFE